MNDYSFTKLLKAQYSWKNERLTFFINFIISSLFAFTATLPEGIASLSVLFILFTMFGFLLTTYYTLKTLFMSVFCGLVCHMCKEGDLKAQGIYGEALEWRQ